jgi:hypothetical protein
MFANAAQVGTDADQAGSGQGKRSWVPVARKERKGKMGTGLEGDGQLLARPPTVPAGRLGVLGRSTAPRAGGPPQRGTARTVPCGQGVRDGPRFTRLLAPQGIVGVAPHVVLGDQGDPENPCGAATVATVQSTEPAIRYHANAGLTPSLGADWTINGDITHVTATTRHKTAYSSATPHTAPCKTASSLTTAARGGPRTRRCQWPCCPFGRRRTGRPHGPGRGSY